MSRIPFTKAEGAQNDFVVVDDRNGELTREQRAEFSRRTSHRRKGVGSDGTIFIDSSEENDFTMSFYNPDGSVGSMCGNGGRCAALYAIERGIAGPRMSFDVLGKRYTASQHGETIRLYFPEPEALLFNQLIDVDGNSFPIHEIRNGAPHAVLIIDEVPTLRDIDISRLPVNSFGKRIRHLERFSPEGVNVNFVSVDEGGNIDIRTFEKGVEAETAACGTGTMAAAMTVHAVQDIPPPLRLRTHGGDLLTVGFRPDTAAVKYTPRYFAEELYLEGSAKLVFEGNFDFSL